MRILHCSDLHANDRWFRWLVQESQRFDLVCIAGDLLDLNPYRSINGQLETVTSYLREIRAPLALCSGNHDSLAGAGARLEHASWLRELRGRNVWVDGDLFELGGFRFRCVPWFSRENCTARDEIWVIHSPPDQSQTGMTRSGADFGDFNFGEQCRSRSGPWLALSGHVHNPQSWHAQVGRTWSLNPGCAERLYPPRHVVIDLDRGLANWRGPGDAEGPILLR